MKKSIIAIVVGYACLMGVAQAEVKINGFASIVAGKASSGDQLFGYDDDISFKEDSLFALQTSADLGDKLSVTAQILSRGENDFQAEFEWAYLSYDISDNLKLNLGRQRIPFYRYSDFLDVGYAYKWVRPPELVYFFPFSSYEGASLLHTTYVGDWDISTQFIYGVLDDDDLGAPGATVSDMLGLNLTANREWLTLRAGYMVGDVDIPNAQVAQLVDITNALGLSALASELAIDEDNGYFGGVALGIDYNDWLLDAEYVQWDMGDSMQAAQKAWYISAGKRLGNVTLYVNYGKQKDEPADEIIALIPSATAGVPIPVSETATMPYGQLIAGAILSQQSETESAGVGLRYNFHAAAALKVEFEQRDVDAVDQSLMPVSEEDSVLRVGVDMVF